MAASERLEPFVKTLRAAHPQTPIVLVEDRNYTDAFLIRSKRQRNETSQAALRAAYKRLKTDGVKNLHYIPAAKLLGALPPPASASGPLAESRTLSLGAALIHASIGLGDRSADALKAAAAQLDPIATTYKANTPALSAAPLKARLGLIRAGQPVPVRPRSANIAIVVRMHAASEPAVMSVGLNADASPPMSLGASVLMTAPS